MKTVSLSILIKQAKVNGKVARARLRRADAAPRCTSKTRWEFAAADAAKVRAIIKAA